MQKHFLQSLIFVLKVRILFWELLHFQQIIYAENSKGAQVTFNSITSLILWSRSSISILPTAYITGLDPLVCCQNWNSCLLITAGWRAKQMRHSPRKSCKIVPGMQSLSVRRLKPSAEQTSGKTQTNETGRYYKTLWVFFFKSAEMCIWL